LPVTSPVWQNNNNGNTTIKPSTKNFIAFMLQASG
jgi:hypothetical protein